MSKKFRGTIVLESITNELILNELKVIDYKVTNQENPEERWHIFTVEATQEQIKKISNILKPEGWYAHFWKGDDIIAIFPNKIFRFQNSDRSTWSDAIYYGKSINIPEEQLDFIIDE